MRKFRAKSNIVLGLLSALSLMAFIAVENSKIDVKQEWFEEKLSASRLSQEAANTIKIKKKKIFIYTFVDNSLSPVGPMIPETNKPSAT